MYFCVFFFFKQKTAYEVRISDWSSDVCSSDLILAALLFVMFQAVFAWSEAPIGMIEGWFAAVGTFVTQQVPEGIVRSFLVDGVINGVDLGGRRIIKNIILFLFILMLEATGRSEESQVGQVCVNTTRSGSKR